MAGYLAGAAECSEVAGFAPDIHGVRLSKLSSMAAQSANLQWVIRIIFIVFMLLHHPLADLSFSVFIQG